MATTTVQVISLPLTLSVKSVAESLSCSEDHVRALIAKRELPASRVGNRILIKRTDVEDLLVACRGEFVSMPAPVDAHPNTSN